MYHPKSAIQNFKSYRGTHHTFTLSPLLPRTLSRIFWIAGWGRKLAIPSWFSPNWVKLSEKYVHWLNNSAAGDIDPFVLGIANPA
ncbi:hypothetical protein NDA06_06095 [Trichocoleus sp. ST-U1]